MKSNLECLESLLPFDLPIAHESIIKFVISMHQLVMVHGSLEFSVWLENEANHKVTKNGKESPILATSNILAKTLTTELKHVNA